MATASPTRERRPSRELLAAEITVQKRVYQEKGYGLIVAICIALFFFFVLPPLVKPHWTRIVGLFPSEQVMFVWGTFGLHQVVFITINLVLWLIYHVELPFFERYKIQPHPWPWKRGPEALAEWRSLVWKSIGLVAVNQLCVSLPGLYSEFSLVKKRGFSFDEADFPSCLSVALHITLFMILEDTFFYWGHRALHHRAVYAHFHKLHHTYKVTVGIASEYTHPLEFLFTNGIPFMAGPVLTGCHMYIFWAWLILRVAETADGHCGYEFSWSPYRLIPFSGSAKYHDYHHSVNVGNYSSFFTWWDSLCGTNGSYRAAQQRAADAKAVATAADKTD